MTLEQLAEQLGVDATTVQHAAESCARILTEQFGSADKAAEALTADMRGTLKPAMDVHTKRVERLTELALADGKKFARTVAEVMTAAR